MDTVDGHAPDVDAASSSPRTLLLAWAGPATMCGLVIAVVSLVSPFAGGIIGIAGIAYLVTSLLLTVGVILLARAGSPRPRPLVAVLIATWTSAWVLGVVTFGLIALLLGSLDDGSATPSEGFVISPVFWLLSFPTYVVFLVTALLFRPRRGNRRQRP